MTCCVSLSDYKHLAAEADGVSGDVVRRGLLDSLVLSGELRHFFVDR